jgi:hypothetical protein
VELSGKNAIEGFRWINLQNTSRNAIGLTVKSIDCYFASKCTILTWLEDGVGSL